MDYVYHLNKFWCKVFLKPNSEIFTKTKRSKLFIENNRDFISGFFIDIDRITKVETTYFGTKETFCFVHDLDFKNYKNSENKQEYIYEINSYDIVSIEMVFDEVEYKKHTTQQTH